MPDPANPFHDLRRRMRPVHATWQEAAADLTLDQVNHFERPGVLPIAFSLMHLVTTEDRVVSTALLGTTSMLWVEGDWPAKVGNTVPDVRRGTPMEVAEQLRFADVDAWRAYQTAVFAQTMAALEGADASRWDEVMFEAVPAYMHGGFLHMLVGDGVVTVGDYVEVVVYHHGLRHLGELEHARGLVGLRGIGG